MGSSSLWLWLNCCHGLVILPHKMRHIVLIEGLIILSTIFVGNPGSYVYGLPVVDHALTLDNLDVPTPPVKSHITVPNATISHMTKSDIVLGKDKAVKDAVNADKALKDAVKAADPIAVEDVQLTKESGGGGGSLAVIIVACSVKSWSKIHWSAHLCAIAAISSFQTSFFIL